MLIRVSRRIVVCIKYEPDFRILSVVSGLTAVTECEGNVLAFTRSQSVPRGVNAQDISLLAVATGQLFSDVTFHCQLLMPTPCWN
jgi:hypothetical protein